MTLNPTDVLRKLTHKDIVSTRIFEFLPEALRNKDVDPGEALKAFFGAVQEEFDQNKESIDEILFLIDPYNINNRFILQGYPTFTHGSQQVTYSGGTATTITLANVPPGVSGDDFLVDFGIYIVYDTTYSGLKGSYRRVTDYNGSTKVATVDTPWPTGLVPTTGVIWLAWPDRVYIPIPIMGDAREVSGTTLPEQPGSLANNQIMLPGVFYLSSQDDVYNGYYIEILLGTGKGQTRLISDYEGSTRIATLEKAWAYKPIQGDWFKITHPTRFGMETNDYYKDKYVRVLSNTKDPTVNYDTNLLRGQIQTRRILRSEYDPYSIPASHICYIHDPVLKEGETWILPPDPDSYIGIVNHYVSLTYLARQVGYRLDAEDPENLQRSQIGNAFNFYKLKGTKRAFEIICRSFGMIPSVQEQGSNYSSAPDPVNVGPDHCSPRHTQYSVSPSSFEEKGLGEDGVPCSWYVAPGKDIARIPDSDIKVYLKRAHPNIVIDERFMYRLIDKLEDVRPIHVEILYIGLLESFLDSFGATEDLAFEGMMSLSETFDASESLFVLSDSQTWKFSDDTVVDEELLIRSKSRWDYMSHRYEDFPKSRYDVGKIYHRG